MWDALRQRVCLVLDKMRLCLTVPQEAAGLHGISEAIHNAPGSRQQLPSSTYAS